MGFDLGSTTVTIGADMKPVDNAMKKVKGDLKSLSETKTSIGFGLAIGAGMAAFELAAKAITAIAEAVPKAAKAAADLGMQMHRTHEIFGQMSPMIDKTISGLSKSFGYGKTSLSDMASNLGLMFVGMGLGNEATAQLSASFLKLGTDASVLYDMDLPEFMNRLEGGIAGANRGLRKMGIFIDDNKVAMERFRLSSMGIIGVTEEQSIQLARTSLIMAGLARSAGQADWAHKQLGGTLRETTGRIEELWTSFGEAVKPAWTAVMTLVNGALKWMQDRVEANKVAIKTWGESVANWIGRAGVFFGNLGLWAKVAGLHIQEAMQKSGVWFGYFLDVTATGLVWLGRNWKTALTDMGAMIATAFTNIGGNLGKLTFWIYDQWKNLWSDLANIVTTTLSNLGENFKRFGKAAYDWIKSGFRSPFEMKMVGLGEGAAPTKTGAMPEFDAVLKGFKAASEAFILPGLPKEKLKEITDDFNARIEKVMKQMGIFVPPGKEKGEGKLGPGMSAPLMPGMGTATGGFVGIADFAKKIQEGALGKDAYMMATANNTRRTNELLMMFGARLGQEMLGMGMAGP